MIARLLRWLCGHDDTPDLGLQIEAAKFGTRPPNATAYDQVKAIKAARQARRQSETGKPLYRPKKSAKPPARVTPFRSKQA